MTQPSSLVEKEINNGQRQDEMNGKINEKGGLAVLRAGTWIEQYCPGQNRDIRCGRWCPAFEEQEATHPEGIFPVTSVNNVTTMDVPLKAGIQLNCFPNHVWFDLEQDK